MQAILNAVTGVHFLHTRFLILIDLINQILTNGNFFLTFFPFV